MPSPTSSTDRALVLLVPGLLAAAFATYGSLLPFRFRTQPLSLAIADLTASSANPLSVYSWSDFVSNVLLFVPIGFFLTGTAVARGARLMRAALAMAGATLAFSFTLELCQEFIFTRVACVTDVEAETLGSTAGIALWVACGPRAAAWLNARVAAIRHRPALRLLTFYAALYGLLMLLPLDVTIRPVDIAEKYAAGRLVDTSFFGGGSFTQGLVRLILETLVAAPVGALAAVRWNAPKPRATLNAVAIASGVIVCLALGQVFVFSRATDLAAALAGSGGAALGALAAVTALTRRRDMGVLSNTPPAA